MKGRLSGAKEPTEIQKRAESYGCYCTLWDDKPEVLRQQGVPEGYCGLCSTCGRPGHTRAFPGASPYTGTWCDRHYRQTMIFHPSGRIGCILYLVLLLIPALAVLASILYQLFTLGR